MSTEPVTTTLFDRREAVAFPAGTPIFSQGDASDTIYVVKSGQVAITKGGASIATLGPGEIFGEMSIISDDPRSAGAEAVTDAEVVEVGKEQFDFMVAQTPGFAQLVMRTMAHRLRHQNDAHT